MLGVIILTSLVSLSQGYHQIWYLWYSWCTCTYHNFPGIVITGLPTAAHLKDVKLLPANEAIAIQITAVIDLGQGLPWSTQIRFTAGSFRYWPNTTVKLRTYYTIIIWNLTDRNWTRNTWVLWRKNWLQFSWINAFQNLWWKCVYFFKNVPEHKNLRCQPTPKE